MNQKILSIFSFFFFLSLLSAQEKPIFKAGIVSDTHVTPREASCIWVKKAWQLFKKKQVDLVINCGDIADHHYPQGYRHYRNVINKLYPDKSKKPLELYAYANHDRIGVANIDQAFAAVKKHLEVPNDPYDQLLVKGYPFIIVPQLVDLERYEKMIRQAIKAHPGKPVFVIDHIPPYNTTYNTVTWGHRPRRELLNKFPQVVNISGHTHNTLFNELCIWQGEFTSVNAGSLHYWGGALNGTVPEGRKRSTEVLIMEVFKNKILFRRYSLLDGSEYNPAAPWCVPLPFDPKTAPYNPKVRFANSKVPSFPAKAKMTMIPDAVPFNNVTLKFTPAIPDVFTYTVTLEKQNAAKQFEVFTVKEIFSDFYLSAAQKAKDMQTVLSGGYFDGGATYRISLTPVNFYGKKGKPFSLVWKAPAKVQNKVRYESKNPMKELSFMSDIIGGSPVLQRSGFYLHNHYNARLLLPDSAWQNIPRNTPMRLTIDLHTIQGAGKTWTLTLRNIKPSRNAHARVTTAPGNVKCRYVIDFRMQNKGYKYALLIREADPGQLRIIYLKLEQLKTDTKTAK